MRSKRVSYGVMSSGLKKGEMNALVAKRQRARGEKRMSVRTKQLLQGKMEEQFVRENAIRRETNGAIIHKLNDYGKALYRLTQASEKINPEHIRKIWTLLDTSGTLFPLVAKQVGRAVQISRDPGLQIIREQVVRKQQYRGTKMHTDWIWKFFGQEYVLPYFYFAAASHGLRHRPHLAHPWIRTKISQITSIIGKHTPSIVVREIDTHVRSMNPDSTTHRMGKRKNVSDVHMIEVTGRHIHPRRRHRTVRRAF